MKCGYHPEREAVGVCVGCGRGICEFCKTILNDKLYCPNCVEKGITEPEKPQKPTVSAQATKDEAKLQPQNIGISSNSVDKPAKKAPPSTSKVIAGIFIISLIIGIIAYFAGCTKDHTLKLEATITHANSQFTITNNNDFDWQNVDLQINSGIISNGFEYKTGTVVLAGHTYNVQDSQFANGDGVRFNSITYKVNTFYISCDNDGDGLIDGSGMWSFQ